MLTSLANNYNNMIVNVDNIAYAMELIDRGFDGSNINRIALTKAKGRLLCQAERIQKFTRNPGRIGKITQDNITRYTEYIKKVDELLS